MVRWMCSVRSEEKISAEELKTRLKLMSMGGYRIEDRNSLVTQKEQKSALSSKYRTLKVFLEYDEEEHGMR